MPAQPQMQTAERRQTVRQRSFLRGTISFNNRRSVLDCLIRDLSPYGARLIFSGAVTVSDVLELQIPQKVRTLRAHVLWRHGRELGVAFAQHIPTDGLTEDDLADRVQRLEGEVASLKRLIRQLKATHEFEPD